MHERRAESAWLREFLAARDAACPGCGYSLRGLESGACQECGVRVRLGVMTEGTTGLPWLAARDDWPRWVTRATHPAVLTGTAALALLLAAGPPAAAVPVTLWTMVFAILAFGSWARRMLREPGLGARDRTLRLAMVVAATGVFLVAASAFMMVGLGMGLY